jgi:hypothetical protein
VAVTSHSPEHWAVQDPWQFATALADPSHVAFALHVPLHWPLSCPGAQRTVTSPGEHVASPVQLASQDAWALALTLHSPPAIDNEQITPALAFAVAAALIWLAA